jgi:hypothetical protein
MAAVRPASYIIKSEKSRIFEASMPPFEMSVSLYPHEEEEINA